LAGIERARQRQAVVALADRVVGLLQGGSGLPELGAGVLLGAGGACGIDGPLGAVDFLLWGLGAARAEQQGAEQDDSATHRAGV
jgi:hypothetical protein